MAGSQQPRTTNDKLRWLFAAACALFAWSCGERPISIDTIAERYVRAALQLAQHDPQLVEAWRGPESWRPGPRVPVATIMDAVTALQSPLDMHAADGSHASEQARVGYLRGQLRALKFAAGRLLGRASSVDDQAQGEFGVAFGASDPQVTAHTLANLDRLLAGNGSVADRLAALRDRTTIPRDRRAAVLALAVKACRDRAAAVLDLPSDERVTIELQSGLAWDGFARYAGSHHTVIAINSDGALDVARAMHLACHEGYAGHHAQHLLIDRVAGQRPELLLTPGFGPHLFYAEGGAEIGADVALTPDQQRMWYRDHLFPAAQLDAADIGMVMAVGDLLPRLLPVVTDVARAYLDTRITQAQAIERLRNEALVANPEGTLAFIERRRARALVYGEGRRAIRRMLSPPLETSLAGLVRLIESRTALQ